MPSALILSSFVAGSRVGGVPQALVMANLAIDPVLVPTVLFGRRPGPGAPPGGGPVDDRLFRGMLEGVRANGLYGLFDAVVTGYFASADQVEGAAEAIDAIRTAARHGAFGPRVTVVVDPIMGDEPDGLYVREEVARAVETLLVPRANVLTPNVWELKRLTGVESEELEALAAAARGLGRPVLVTSASMGEGRIGAVYADDTHACAFSHARLDGVPNGTGDVVAAVLAAHMIDDAPAAVASERAIRAAAETAFAAVEWRAPELPVVALGARLKAPTAEVEVRALDGAAPRRV